MTSHNLSYLLDMVDYSIHNDRVIMLNELREDILARYEMYNEFAQNYSFNEHNYINALDIAISTRASIRHAINESIYNSIIDRMQKDRIKKLRVDKDSVYIRHVTRASGPTVTPIPSDDISIVKNRLTSKYIELSYDNYIYNKIVAYAKNKMKECKMCEGEVTLEFIVNGVYTKYLELLLSDNKLVTLAYATIEHKHNVLVHTFALIKKSLSILNYGHYAQYNDNDLKLYSTFHGDNLLETRITVSNGCTLQNTRNVNTRKVTIIDLLKQYENRNNRKERALYTYDNGTSEADNITVEDDTMSSLVKSSARDIVQNIIKSTNNIDRIIDILRNDLSDNASRKCLSKWKHSNKLDDLSRDDLFYLFCM